MKTPEELLNAAKSASGSNTDTELAAKLGVKPSAVSNYRRGVSLPDEVVCEKIAKITGIKLSTVLGIVGEARAISPQAKAVWRRLATAAAIAIAIGVLPGQPAIAGGSSISETPAQSMHYAKWLRAFALIVKVARSLRRWSVRDVLGLQHGLNATALA